jgi:hypothetical protein
MLDRPWEIEAPSLAITIAWGDVALHTAHLSRIRSFTLGDSTADCVLPDGVVGPGRIPLILAERGALYLVLLPAMDPEGTVSSSTGKPPRTVADLARPGISRALDDVPGAFLIELAPGASAALSLGAFTIAITLETKAACAVAGHFHASRRMVPFQLGSAALHLALMGLAVFLAPAFPEDPNDVSSERMYFIQQALERVDEKEMEENEALADAYGGPDQQRYQEQRFAPRPYRGASFSTFGAMDYGNDSYTSKPPVDLARARLAAQLVGNEVVDDDGVNAEMDPNEARYSALAIDVDTTAYATTRRTLLRGEAPALESVRPEAFLNSFDYGYDGPARNDDSPFAVHFAAAPSPFDAGHHLVRVGIQGRRGVEVTPEIIARDVTIRADWNPDAVRTYRLLGYENRARRGDYRGDEPRGAGNVVAGHSVTAIYDVVFASTMVSPVNIRLQYRSAIHGGRREDARYVMSGRAASASFAAAPRSLRLATAVIGFAEILRKNPYAKGWRIADVERIAIAASGDTGPDQELLSLIRAARSLDEPRPTRVWAGRVADASLMGF